MLWQRLHLPQVLRLGSDDEFSGGTTEGRCVRPLMVDPTKPLQGGCCLGGDHGALVELDSQHVGQVQAVCSPAAPRKCREGNHSRRSEAASTGSPRWEGRSWNFSPCWLPPQIVYTYSQMAPGSLRCRLGGMVGIPPCCPGWIVVQPGSL